MLADINDEYESFQPDFERYIKELACNNQTVKFWAGFLFEDCFAYICLYCGIRCGMWDLRSAGIKSMAVPFTAFDRQKYEKLTAQHVVDMLSIPDYLLANLQDGGFSVSILGRPGHSVGIDECHEMAINKDCKTYIKRPTDDYINRISLFLPIRSSAMKNIEKQVLPAGKVNDKQPALCTVYTHDVRCKKHEANILSQLNKLEKSTLTDGNELQHLFKTEKPSPEQIHDLMHFRDIGESDYKEWVEYYILRTPAQPPRHKKSLLTFTEKCSRRKKGSQIERERKLQIELWKKRVAFASSTGSQLSLPYEQCIELPRAIANIDGTPVKGTKSKTTHCLERRYEKVIPPIISSALNISWIPEVVVMEGMFLINYHLGQYI